MVKYAIKVDQPLFGKSKKKIIQIRGQRLPLIKHHLIDYGVKEGLAVKVQRSGSSISTESSSLRHPLIDLF